MKHTINRKYNLGNFESVDIMALETEDEPLVAIEKLDKIANDYRQELEKRKAKDLPTKTYRIGNEYFYLNQKEDKLYKKEPSDQKLINEERKTPPPTEVPF